MKIVCKICNIELQDEYAYKGHLGGKKHLNNMKRCEMEAAYQRSVFISNIPAYILVTPEGKENLLEFLSQFGQIKYYKFYFSSGIIEFTTIEPVEYLLSNCIYYEHSRLKINQRIVKTQRQPITKGPEAINETEELDLKKFQHIFDTDMSFDMQLAKFLETISISSEEIETRYESTCVELKQIIQKIYPKCEIHRFGSTVSGLGFKNCDLDIYVDVGIPVCESNTAPEDYRAIVLNDIKRLLYSKTRIFANVVPIPKAKTPIIKFTFLPTNVRCDISFKNSLAVYNSQLVKHCLMMDEKLRPAMMILKYWISNYEQRGGSRMSKYALTLLFLFYCQQPSVNCVPPIVELKKKCKKAEIVEGWQVNFDTSPRPQTENKVSSVPQLLHGFFEFYAGYNFKLNVVCPLDGVSHRKKILLSEDTLPSSMDLYKQYLRSRKPPTTFFRTRLMCVQDPNELNYNVTSNIDSKYLESFQMYCSVAADLCRSEAENDYKGLLAPLFALKLELPKKSKSKTFIFYSGCYLDVGLPDDFESRDDIEDKGLFASKCWFDLVINLIQKFFERVLKLQVQLRENKLELKQQKVEQESDVHTNAPSKVAMRCSGDACMWRNRRGNAVNIDPSLSLIEKEAAITDALYEALKSKGRLSEETIDFECDILKKSNKNPYVLITLTNKDCSKNYFDDITSYIKSKMVTVLDKTLHHMKQYKKKTIDF